jgi:hypothetical protein
VKTRDGLALKTGQGFAAGAATFSATDIQTAFRMQEFF